MNWKPVAGAVLLLALSLAALALRPHTQAGPCLVVSGPAMLPDIPEASGLAISRRTPGLIWSHNDSGNADVLFALDASGTVRGRVRVPIRTRDWEDISAARCPAGDCLYMADIGDNRAVRRRVQVLRVPEPSPRDTQTVRPDVFSLAYPDGAHNAEAAFVAGNDFYIVTRDRRGGLYRAPLPAADSGELTLVRVGELGLEAVTDAETSPDGTWLVVRTSHEVVFYRTAGLTRGVPPAALRAPIDGLRETQGEGVALDADGMLYLASEGWLWNRAGRLLALRCALPR